jgi:hypothetical protein
VLDFAILIRFTILKVQSDLFTVIVAAVVAAAIVSAQIVTNRARRKRRHPLLITRVR